MNLTGNMVAMVTPFRNDAIEMAALERYAAALVAGAARTRQLAARERRGPAPR